MPTLMTIVNSPTSVTLIGVGGQSDHGHLAGLSDDDHTQYHNNTRGDARYYTKSQIDTEFDAVDTALSLLAPKANATLTGTTTAQIVTVTQLKADGTNTAGGTTGAQTINKMYGSVNFAASATSLVVTNSLVSATSIVIAVLQAADATFELANKVVCGAGSFTIYAKVAPTAESKVGFVVFNKS